jgi:hypothetical protein
MSCWNAAAAASSPPAAFTTTRSTPVRPAFRKAAAYAGCAWPCWCRSALAARVWALPFLTALCPSERYAPYVARGRRHKPLPERARGLLGQVRRWLPQRALIVVADSRYAALELLAWCARHTITVITRLRLDAALYEPAPHAPARPTGPPVAQRRAGPQADRAAAGPPHRVADRSVALVRRPGAPAAGAPKAAPTAAPAPARPAVLRPVRAPACSTFPVAMGASRPFATIWVRLRASLDCPKACPADRDDSTRP